MKLYAKVFSVVIAVTAANFVAAHDEASHQPVAITLPAPVIACHCVPTEHWFYKACVKNYNVQFPQAGLPENYDTEGLPENVLQAIEMLALDMAFVAQDGTEIVPTVNAKGKLVLAMSKNQDYVFCKQILHHVDTTTTLSAQELYELWTATLEVMKAAQ